MVGVAVHFAMQNDVHEHAPNGYGDVAVCRHSENA
jgi:hypothetical protein